MHVAVVARQGRKILGFAACKFALVAVFLAFATVCGVTLTPAHAQDFSFSNVTVEGNERVDTQTIISYTGIAPGTAVSAGQLNDAYQRVVDSGLFETVELVPQGRTLLIRVKELPTINVINFEGNRRLKDEALSAIVQSQARRVYSPSQAEADAAAIADAYEQTGRLAASVEPRIIRRDGNRVDLVFDIREGGVVEVERIGFVGNRAFSDRRLRQVLETKQAGILRALINKDTFAADRLEFDKQLLRDFYASRGYVDFEVLDATGDVSRERDAVFVTFTLREGQSFKVGKVTTVSEIPELDAAEFEAVNRLRSGVTYSPTVIDNNIARMENLALKKGLNFVRVEPRITRNDRDLTLDIEFAIVRGERIFVERIDIEGNSTTRDDVIRRQFRTVEGDPFNPRELRRAAARIRALGYFSQAEVNAEPGSAADQVVVNVDVTEQPTGSLGFGLSYGVESGVGVSINFSEDNFLGRGQSVAVNLLTGTDNRSANLTFVEPAFLGRDLRFSTSLNYGETDRFNARYNTNELSARTSLGFPISVNGRLDLNFRIASSEISDVRTGSSAILQSESDRGALTTVSVGYAYSYDTRREGLNPLGGILLRFSQDFAVLGGDLNYIETNAIALAERRVLNEEVTLRAIIEGGVYNSLSGDDSRVTERFFGNGKVRGFEYNGYGPRDLAVANRDALGGNVFAAARFEAEFPIGLPEEYGIRGGVFFDVGSVWSLNNVDGGANGSDGLDLVDDSFHLRSSIGVSVFWNTPIGPLRFNLAKALEKQPYDEERVFDLTISTSF